MSQQALTGYVLHARPYQEKRCIYQCFSQEFGMVHGVGIRGMPIFTYLSFFASGKQSLKNFTQMSIEASDDLSFLQGESQYALLYMNEVLCRLLAIENPCPTLWQQYHHTVRQLKFMGVIDSQDASKSQRLRQLLRAFERVLFLELGLPLVFDLDKDGFPIDANQQYYFIADSGFAPLTSKESPSVQTLYAGWQILAMSNIIFHDKINQKNLTACGKIHKIRMDHLLDYRPLNSRKLWQQSQYYQNMKSDKREYL